MATETLHGDVLVPGIDNLFPDGVAAMFRPVVATLAKFNRGRLLQQENTIGRMGSVACLAISFLNGRVGKGPLDHPSLCRRLFLHVFLSKPYLILHRIRMALSAKTLRIPDEQFLLSGGMRFMAVQTSPFVNERPMDSVLIKRVIHHAAMATPTEFVTRSSGLKRSWGIRGLVALRTDFIGNRSVHIIKQYSSPVRAMGAMAGRTIRLCYRVVHVLLSKGRSIGLVTTYAEANQIVF
jgi:hypothetical protein